MNIPDNLFERPFIKFLNTSDFDEVSNWNFTDGDVIDIGVSEQVIIFKDNDTLQTWENAILFNHIKPENLKIELI